MANIIISIFIGRTLRPRGLLPQPTSQLAGSVRLGMGLECGYWNHASSALFMTMPIINSVTSDHLMRKTRALEVRWTPRCPLCFCCLRVSCLSYACWPAQFLLFAWQAGGKTEWSSWLGGSIPLSWCVFLGWWHYTPVAIRHLCDRSLSQAWDSWLYFDPEFGIWGCVCFPLWAQLWCGVVEVVFVNFSNPTRRRVGRKSEGSSLDKV